MLKTLRVKDFAIIDEIILEFDKGFTVFTGETGAGKSILVDALSLVMGGRASMDMIREGKDTAVVEALFEGISNPVIKERLCAYGLDSDNGELIIRRIISRSGKNRIFINGALSTTSMLKDICSGLIDIHGQHEHQLLLRKETHIEYLDAFGGLTELRNRVREGYRRLGKLQKNLEDLENDFNHRREKEELYRHQIDEINRAELKPGEDTILLEERKILTNYHRISFLSEESYTSLYGNERAILVEIDRVKENLEKLARISPEMGEVLELVDSSRINLKEASERIRNYKDSIEFTPDRLEIIEERLYTIERLKKKYGRSIEDILAYKERIEQELELLQYSGRDIEMLKKEIEEVSISVESSGRELTELRKETAKRLEEEVMKELSSLSMNDIRFVINIDKQPLSSYGYDSVEFMIANINEALRPISKVASGGELSRLLLAIKSRLSAMDNVETLIFDEIDAGIGGKVGEEVGKKLRYLAEAHQVLCVTHLPQIASMVDTHFFVEKVVLDNRVTTRVRQLDESGRIEELRRMLGGMETDTATRYAEEMLGKYRG